MSSFIGGIYKIFCDVGMKSLLSVGFECDFLLYVQAIFMRIKILFKKIFQINLSKGFPGNFLSSRNINFMPFICTTVCWNSEEDSLKGHGKEIFTPNFVLDWSRTSHIIFVKKFCIAGESRELMLPLLPFDDTGSCFFAFLIYLSWEVGT